MKSALKIFPRSFHSQEFIVPLQGVKKSRVLRTNFSALLAGWLDCEQLSLIQLKLNVT
jgi:hypothetical protein